MLGDRTGWSRARRGGLPCCQHSQHSREPSSAHLRLATGSMVCGPQQAMPPCPWGGCHQPGAPGCGRPGCPADGPHCRALPQVRVFTFSVGQHNYDVTPLQWMACANKGERGWHLAGTGGCRMLGSPLARGLAPVLQCMPLPGRCWLQLWRPGQQDSQTAGQTDSWLSSCLSLSFPRLLL